MPAWLRHWAAVTRSIVKLTIGRGKYERALARLPRLDGIALVVGSAPSVTLPLDVAPDWAIVTVNASQIITDGAGLQAPTLSIFRDRIWERRRHQDDVWRTLSGRRTPVAVPIIATADDHSFGRKSAARGYVAERVAPLPVSLRAAIICEMSRSGMIDLKGPRSISNGLFAALLALKLGASSVVMSGFSLSGGRYGLPHDTPGFGRAHRGGDAAMTRLMRRRGLPIFAADEGFAEATGLRRWPPPAPEADPTAR